MLEVEGELGVVLGGANLAELLDQRQFRLKPPTRLEARRSLPATLNNYSLRFALDG